MNYSDVISNTIKDCINKIKDKLFEFKHSNTFVLLYHCQHKFKTVESSFYLNLATEFLKIYSFYNTFKDYNDQKLIFLTAIKFMSINEGQTFTIFLKYCVSFVFTIVDITYDDVVYLTTELLDQLYLLSNIIKVLD